MKHTTPPLDYSGLPNTDAEFQKYKDARTEGYSIMKALIELKSEAGIHDLAQLEQIIQEHLAMEPIMIAPWRNSVPLTQTACRDGMRLAALDFYWEHPRKIRLPDSSESPARVKGSGDTDAHGRECAARSEITDEIQNSITNGREPELSEKSQKHLITCASCRSELPFWLDLARAAREVDEEDEMIWAAEGGDPAIAQRSVAGGFALFKPSAGADGRGLMLIVDPNDWMDVRSVHRDVTRQDFQAMS